MALGIPGIADFRRRTVRAPLNPLDKSTVVSIYPKLIDEVKHTIQPGRFIIEPGTYDKPALLVVTSSSWWKELDEEQPLLEIPNSSIQVADSIVKDYCNGLLACNMSDAMPGLFFIPGEITPVELKSKHKAQLDRARDNQKRWYMALVQMADALWARSNGNPLTISEDMRLAARELGLNSKDWLRDFQNIESIRCVACGAMRNPAYPVCQTCHAIVDQEMARKLNLQFAKG